MTKERIEIIRQSLIPFVKKELLKINYEGLGKSDAEEFEKDLNEVLDLASKALEQQSSDDCVNRQAVIDYLHTNMTWYDENGSIADDSQKLRDITNLVNGIPPTTSTYGTCNDCRHNVKDTRTTTKCEKRHRFFMREPSTFCCIDFEKRGSENESIN